MRFCLLAMACIAITTASPACAAEPELPIVFQEDFEKGADRWQPLDAAQWKVIEDGKGHVFAQYEKKSQYKPPHRSPTNIALLKDVKVGDFELTAKVKSTTAEYGHRDACIVFGYQDPANFYYVHLGSKTDDHANQIFLVNDAPRTKISSKTTEGTKWTDEWHTIKVVRKVADGTIEIYYDDMQTPCMTATDKHFGAGRIGVGTFDDTANYDDIVIRGAKADK